MADIDLTARAEANKSIDPVHKPADADQRTLPAGEDLTAGTPVLIDPTTGCWLTAKADTAENARYWGLVLRNAAKNTYVTAYRRGEVDGFDLDGLDYDDPVYLSDTGTLADAAGTIALEIGRVVPGTATQLGASFDKKLYLDPLYPAPDDGGSG